MAGPNRPEPKPIAVDAGTTAVAVLDLSARCHDPSDVCSKLLEGVGRFLGRTRELGLPIIFTVSASVKGTPLGEVAQPLGRRKAEPVIYPDAFDKFAGGELHAFLSRRGVKNLVIVGSVANVCVLYTSTTATRVHKYNVAIPLDGINARTNYELEYSLHQLTVLPAGANQLIKFTAFDIIQFNDRGL